MAVIQRPSKQGGSTTYQGKVAAGYTKILAAEMDADLDTIYSAWNTGVDTVNIADGSITGAKLAPGAVGSRELADSGVQTVDLADGAVTTPKLADGAIVGAKIPDGSVATAKLADGAVTSAKIANGTITDVDIGNVAWTKLVAPFVGALALDPRGYVLSGTASVDISGNAPSAPQYDGGKPSWLIRLDYALDAFQVWRSPPPGTAFVKLCELTAAGKLVTEFADLSVGRAELAVNAVYGPSAFAVCPAFSLSTPVGQWVNYMTLAPITTRGGLILLIGQHNLSASGPVGGATVGVRWLRNGSSVGERTWLISSTSTVPLPSVEAMDNPPAGTYTYSMQAWISTNCLITCSPGPAQGFLQAMEIG